MGETVTYGECRSMPEKPLRTWHSEGGTGTGLFPSNITRFIQFKKANCEPGIRVGTYSRVASRPVVRWGLLWKNLSPYAK